MLRFLSPEHFDLDGLRHQLRTTEAIRSPNERERFYLGSYPIIRKQVSNCTFDDTVEDVHRLWVALIQSTSPEVIAHIAELRQFGMGMGMGMGMDRIALELGIGKSVVLRECIN